MSSRRRVLLADDHGIVLEGLRRILERDFDVVGEVADGHALIAAAATLRPDIIVTDISMPLLNGIDAIRQIRKTNRKVRVVFLSMHPDVTFAAEALCAGGSGYVLKNSAGAEILSAIEAALGGRTYVTPSINEEVVRAQMVRIGNRDLPSEITARQREVLQLLAEGKGLKEVAAVLNISIKTAEFHKYRIMRHLGIRTNADLTKYAVRLGIISV